MIWCPVLEIGRNSVSPSTTPRMNAWKAVHHSMFLPFYYCPERAFVVLGDTLAVFYEGLTTPKNPTSSPLPKSKPAGMLPERPARNLGILASRRLNKSVRARPSALVFAKRRIHSLQCVLVA